MFLATTRVAVLRGTVKDALDDEVDANGGSPVAGYESLPCSLIERTRRTFDQSTGTWRSVRYLEGMVRGNVALRPGDRIRDARDGKVYAIDEFTRTPRGLSGQSTVTFEARATSG